MRRHRQLALLGFPGVGKSSLAHHFVYKQFDNQYDPNIKTSLKQTTTKKTRKCSIFIDLQHQCYLNGEEYQLTIVDNAGSDQYTLNHIDLENSDAYILVYAIDDSQRFVSSCFSRCKSIQLFSSFQMVSKIREKILSTSTNPR